MRSLAPRLTRPDPSSNRVAGSGTGAGVPLQVAHAVFESVASKVPPANRLVSARGLTVTSNEPHVFASVMKLTFTGANVNDARATL